MHAMLLRVVASPARSPTSRLSGKACSYNSNARCGWPVARYTTAMLLRVVGFPSPVSHLSPERQGLLIQLQRSLGLSRRTGTPFAMLLRVVGFPGTVSHLSPERQGLLIQLQRSLGLPRRIGTPHAMLLRVAASPARSPTSRVERQGLLIQLQRSLGLPRRTVHSLPCC